MFKPSSGPGQLQQQVLPLEPTLLQPLVPNLLDRRSLPNWNRMFKLSKELEEVEPLVLCLEHTLPRLLVLSLLDTLSLPSWSKTLQQSRELDQLPHRLLLPTARGNSLSLNKMCRQSKGPAEVALLGLHPEPILLPLQELILPRPRLRHPQVKQSFPNWRGMLQQNREEGQPFQFP